MTDRGHEDREGDAEPHGPTVRDKRRIDPQTYQVREPQATAAPAPEGTETPGAKPQVNDATQTQAEPVGATQSQDSESAAQAAELAQLKVALAERTGDLQRLQAEYINYKRRVDRDRDVTRKAGIEGVIKDFLPVLDDLRSAREHEELSGGFKAVADEVERIAGKYGLESFGQAGDPFDPHIHEALLHAHATGIDGPTCVEILQAGYRIGDKILRPARVAVAEPGPDSIDEASSIEEAGSIDEVGVDDVPAADGSKAEGTSPDSEESSPEQ